MKTKFLALMLLSCMLFIACESDSFDDSIEMEKSIDLNKSASSNNSYVVISGTNKLPKNIEKSISAANGSITSSISQIGIVVVSSDDPDFASNASKIKGIQTVVPDYEIQWLDPEMKSFELNDDSYSNPPDSGDDDFFFDLQWGHTAVDAAGAWNAGHRGAGVRVFVLDTGIDDLHPDLAPNLNVGLCRTFVPGEDWRENDGAPTSHGTHVAGTIAAADNGYGVIGIAPEAELVALKVLSSTGSGNWSWLLEALIYAADNGADVINMSLSGLTLSRFGKSAAQLKNAIARATTYAHQNGATVIAAAGNDGWDRNHLRDETGPYSDLLVLPADGPNVVQISATAPIGWALHPTNTFLDNPASYSNHGSMIDFSAPGGDGSYPGNEPCTIDTSVGPVTIPCWAFDLVLSTVPGPNFGWKGGTSMAAPHVAGVAALIIGKNGGDMKPAQVISALKRSSDDLGKPGSDDFYGAGRVNAFRAVTQ